jgi:hypothetical protein
MLRLTSMVALDKTQCLLQGRPPILRVADAEIPLSFFDDYEELEPFDSASFSVNWSYVGVPLRYTSNMRSLCELCLIMERILTNIYGGSFEKKDMRIFYDKAIALQNELEGWLQQFTPLAEHSTTRKVPALPHQLTIK